MAPRRQTELWLLIAAAPVLLLLFALLLVNDGEALSVQKFAVPLGLMAAFAAAHLATRRFAPNADPAILPIAFALSGIGICFVMRLNPEGATTQIVWLFLAVALLVATLILVPSIEKLGNYKYTFLLLTLVLLLLPLTPGLGKEYNGSRIWISLAGMSFQPGEVAKITLVLFLAAYMADNRELLATLHRGPLGLRVPNFRTLVPLIIMWALALLVVVAEKDLGCALLLFGVFLAILFVSTGRKRFVALALALASVGAVGLYQLFDHVQQRVQIWLDPFCDPQNTSWQLAQSLYSLADGGLFGTGIGRGLCTSIPEVSSDFVFSAIAEEMGLLGASAIILLFMLFAVRGFATAARAKSDVAALVAAGLTSAIALQAFIIIGGVTDFIPLTGITLPFMSQGGSSLLSSFIIVGLLLRAGDEGTGLTCEMTTAVKRDAIFGRTALGRHLTVLITVFAVLFALLIANLSYVQLIWADEIQSLSTNNHTITRESQKERGAILTSDNVVLAESVEAEDGSYIRSYPQGSLAAHLVGYFSQTYGTAGVENTMSSTLVGAEKFATLGDAIRAFAGVQTNCNDVVLTINSEVQAAAEEALADCTGACVVLDTATGAVLAQASSPTYDVNDISEILAGTATIEDGALVNRATSTLYAPGSTFKILTAAAALDSGLITPTSTYASPSTLEIGGANITNYNKAKHGTITVTQAIAVSSNTVFAQIASELGADALVAYSEAFGINNSALAQDFAVATSLMPVAAEMTEWETAWAGVGQPVGEHDSAAGPQVTVTQMAVVMAAIANGGEVMQPYIINSVLSAQGNVLSQTSPSSLGQAISEETAAELCEMLETVVASGTGTAAQISGATVIGKTGTAETDKDADNAWFVGTATTASGQSVTIAIVVEEGGGGGSTAAPKARTILQTALQATTVH